ncbi:hypothetical protein ACSBR2_002986 [Camellia fascicularis]
MDKCKKIDLELKRSIHVDVSSANNNFIAASSSSTSSLCENQSSENQSNNASCELLEVVNAEKVVDTADVNSQMEHLPLSSESLEPEGTRKSGKCNLRKSLEWDTAFFTSAGVLDPDELSSMIEGVDKGRKLFVPGIEEEMCRFTDSLSTLESDLTLESLEADLFVDIRASLEKSSKASHMASSSKAPSGETETQPICKNQSNNASCELLEVVNAEKVVDTADVNSQMEHLPLSSESLEPEGTRKSGKCNLRKSLEWDTAFFTSAGVLDPDELSSMIEGVEKGRKLFVPGIEEEMCRFTDSLSTLESDLTLESLEADLFVDIRASLEKSSKASHMASSSKAPSGETETQPICKNQSNNASCELLEVVNAEKVVDTADVNSQMEHLPLSSESLEPEGTRKSGKCNLRKSLEWDTAFFTSAGVLDPDELSSMIEGVDKGRKLFVPGIEEEMCRFTDSLSTLESDLTLESLEADLFVDIRASLEKSSKASHMASSSKAPSGETETQPICKNQSNNASCELLEVVNAEKVVDSADVNSQMEHLPLSSESLEPEGTRKSGKCNLRKSLEWDTAFFTSAGVLDPDELSSMIEGVDKGRKLFVPGVEEEMCRFTDSLSTLESDLTLESLEGDLFEDIRASLEKSSKASHMASSSKAPSGETETQPICTLKKVDRTSKNMMNPKPASKKPNIGMQGPGKLTKPSSGFSQGTQPVARNGGPTSSLEKAPKVIGRPNPMSSAALKRSSLCSSQVKIENDKEKSASVPGKVAPSTKIHRLGGSCRTLQKPAVSLKPPLLVLQY